MAKHPKKNTGGGIDFDAPFLTSRLITCIGNKRSLLPFINSAVAEVKKRLGKKKLSALDGFAGSGAVARLLKYHASELWVNDMERYSEVLNGCYLSNRSEVDIDYIQNTINSLNARKSDDGGRGFIAKNYAPENDNDIKSGERVFYTSANAGAIDNIKRIIFSEIPGAQRNFFLAPLLVEASIHTNTSGVFKGFHKKSGVGCFGGRGGFALSRIKGGISLEMPVFCGAECPVVVKKTDINKLSASKELPPELDIAYYDPPYNQHPYGSNYFMLNIIASRAASAKIQDGESGIALDWNRSAYNKRGQAAQAMERLIESTRAKYILISYNNEGLIKTDELSGILKKYGSCETMSREYNTYRGSRNLNGRNIKVKEILWILKKR
ncbi:MAG: DNA modification methylase [Elusimicrobia bacterium HGW-Elusimicrobia-1]|jgi:adenine-specific DNA-methyltransferase|nr:MAG: DNA modification methylase [Elusimicrobia bacterium HGW-Elusimicrobia-3]PKN01270.1 MAG: DNA modification methylase [Elusimicrobia bacterium HGW-Elusimicrobia-1]